MKHDPSVSAVHKPTYIHNSTILELMASLDLMLLQDFERYSPYSTCEFCTCEISLSRAHALYHQMDDLTFHKIHQGVFTHGDHEFSVGCWLTALF